MELPFEDDFLRALCENSVDPGIDADKLAERIAKTNELVQRIKLLETENEKYLNNALELSQSVQGMKALYDEERLKSENLQKEKCELQKDILNIKAQLAKTEAELNRANLAHEQSIAECKEASKRDIKNYLSLCESVALEFINQANLLNDNELLDKQAHRKVNNIWKKLTENNLTIPILKSPKKFSKKERLSSNGKCEKVISMDAAVDCNLLLNPEPQKQMVSRATQYITSTTTRAASTSAFIKTRSIGTVFPEPLAVTVEEALKATVFELPKPISPINEINVPVARNAGTQTEIFSNKSVGTCTKVRNIRKTARQLFDNDFLMPIKTESPMNSMENLCYTPIVDTKSGANLVPVSVQLMDLWNMLGQKLFSAMRSGSAMQQEQLRAVNERIDMLHLHLQMEILNCLNLITTENNFCMDNYLVGCMGEVHRKRKLSDSSEVSFTIGEFEATNGSTKIWKKNEDEFFSNTPEYNFQETSYTSTAMNNSDKYKFHQQNDRVGDQAVREFFSITKSSSNNIQGPLTIRPDTLNNSRKSVITRNNEVKNPKENNIDELSAPLEETSMPDLKSEDTELNSSSLKESPIMADLVKVVDVVQLSVEKKATEADEDIIILEAKDPTKVTNNGLDQGKKIENYEVKNSIEEKVAKIEKVKECTADSKEKVSSRNNQDIKEITAVDIVLRMFSNCSLKKSNIKVKRLKKLAKKKLVVKQNTKSYRKESCGLKRLKDSKTIFVEKLCPLTGNDLKESVIQSMANREQKLSKINENKNICLNAEKSATINADEKCKLTNNSKQILDEVSTMNGSNESVEQHANTTDANFFLSDIEDVEKIFQKCILNVSPISRLSESCDSEEDTFRMHVEYNCRNSTVPYKNEINIDMIGNKCSIHNILEEHETPQSPPRNEIYDFCSPLPIPLERVPEHDYNYSPLSPKAERIYESVPKTVIIPENNTIKTKSKEQSLIAKKVHVVLGKILQNFQGTKYSRLMKKKVQVEPAMESKEIIKIRQVLEHYIMQNAQSEDVAKCTLRLVKRTKSKEFICKAIIEVIEDTSDRICNLQTPPAPPMTETHKKIVVLVHKLDMYFKGFSQNLMSLLEQKLFNLKEDKLSLEVVINHTLLYIALIDIDNGDKNPARLFIYKCLYYHNKKAIPMIYHILVSYPHVLPKQNDTIYDRSDALISTIQCILNSLIYNMDKTDLKHREVFHILRMYYEYERVKPSKEEVVENLMAKIKAGKLENVSYSFALLCKHFGIEWTEREIVNKNIVPALTECYNLILYSDCYDRQAAVLLESLSFILKPFPLNYDVTKYQQIFTNFLYATSRKIIQDAAVCAILKTQRFSYVNCFKSICNWNPNYNVDKNVRVMLKSFVYRKPYKFWKKIINQI